MNSVLPRLTSREIVAARPPKNAVDPQRPYARLLEQERSASGKIVDVATLFLTNRECPFRCLMCDLWKHTTSERVPLGAIPNQIDFALAQLGPAQHLKLYNSGNFFDPQAIPQEDHAAITQRVATFEHLVVENHPRFCGQACIEFKERLRPTLEIAIGLETIHPRVLPWLNKQMTVDDYNRAAEFLMEHGIAVRTFLLLRPPSLDEAEGIEWTLRSLEHAFDHGASICSIIPTRSGNGIMEQLATQGLYAPPKLKSLETVLEQGLALQRGRVQVDLWDAAKFAECIRCADERIARLARMNLSQQIEPAIDCSCGT